MSFGKAEQRGIVVLLLLLILLILINIFLPSMIAERKSDTSKFEKEIEAFLLHQKQLMDSIENSKKNFTRFRNTPSAELNPFLFDPNGMPVSKWLELGLSAEQVQVIKNYEKKGGTFKTPEDLAKIYSISKEEFSILEPYIVIKGDFKKADEKKITQEIEPVFFDPNLIDKSEWLEMGLREYLVNTIMNYRNKGGKFYKSEDLKNIYGMRNEEFDILEPFIKFSVDTSILANIPTDTILIVEIDINTADTLDLQQLKGIGPSFASRIVKYRELLSGYCRIDQLLEVYGMDETRYSGIKDYVKCSDSEVGKININTATIKEMIRHPYIEFYLAKSILEHRSKIGQYSEVMQVKDAKLIYEELYLKIEPYLSIK